MTPLDLSKKPPRTCRTEIDGIPFVARAIDKARAELPGGDLGVFFSVHRTVSTMSALFYHRFGITHERFIALVSDSANDDAVVAWLRTHADSASIGKFTKQVLSLQLADLPIATLAAVQEMYPDANGADPTTLMIDVIDRDDAAMFA
jgi:hypothetical protein